MLDKVILAQKHLFVGSGREPSAGMQFQALVEQPLRRFLGRNSLEDNHSEAVTKPE